MSDYASIIGRADTPDGRDPSRLSVGKIGAPPAPRAPSPYADTIRELEVADAARAQASTFAAQQSDPDKAARAQQLSVSMGVPPSVIEADLPTFEAQDRVRQASDTLKASPALSSWVLANPESVRIAHDDFDKLGTIEKVITAGKSGFNRGLLEDQMARIGFQKLKSGDSIKTADAEKKLREQMARPDGIDTGFYGMTKMMGSFIGGMTAPIVNSLKYGVAGAAMGSVVPAAGTAVGFGAGMLSGLVMEGFETGAGQIYNQLKVAKDNQGNPVDDDIAKGAAMSGGLVLGLLNLVSAQQIAKPFGEAMSLVVPSMVKKAIEKPTYGKAAAKFATGFAKSAGIGSAFGVMSAATMVAADNIAKMVDSGEWETIANSPAAREMAVEQITEAAFDMAVVFSVLHAAPSSISLMADMRRAGEAQGRRQFIDALADGSIASKTRERSTDAFQKFVMAQTDGTPVENLYIPAEVIMKLYQDAGVDPKNRAQDSLFPFVRDMGEQLDQAGPVNGDVLIKTADYAAHVAGSDVDAKLRDHIRVGQDAMSVEQAKIFYQEYKKEIEASGQRVKAEAEKSETSADQVRTEVQKMLEEAGYKTRTAGGMAQQMAAFFSTIGKRIGMDPMALFEKYGMKIGREEGAAPDGAMEQPVFHGSPHEFDRFELRHIGSGEGARAYGWGLYFAGNRKVAEWYRKQLAGRNDQTTITVGGKKLSDMGDLTDGGITGEAADILEAEGGNIDAARMSALKLVWHARDTGDALAPRFRTILDKLTEWKGLGVKADKSKGRLYEVDIPDHENMLNLESALVNQPEAVQKALKAAGLLTEPNERTKMWAEHEALMNGPIEEAVGINSITYLKDLMAGKLNDEGATMELEAILGDPPIQAAVKRAIELWDRMHEPGMIDQPIDHNQTLTGSALYQRLVDQIKDSDSDSPATSFRAKLEQDMAAEHGGQVPLLQPEELASRYLNSIGIPGLSYLDGSSRRSGAQQNYNYVLFDDSKATILKYEQPGVQAARGYMSLGSDRKIRIGLLEQANLSTFLHESGHSYLEILRDVSKGEGGEALAADVAAIARYLGAENLDNLTTAQHEKWAKSFEAYLMEGRAPSRELAGAFSRFRRWLTTIYQSVSALGVTLTDEVRGVMDRMLASQEDIATARREQRLNAIFEDAKAANMTDAEFAAYRAAVKRVMERADDRIMAKVMEDVTRQRTKAWKAEMAGVRSAVAEELSARPDLSALDALRDGTVRLSKEALQTAYGEDVLTRLPAGRPGRPIYGPDGVHPDDLAEQFGFKSGDAMVRALMKLEVQQRKIRTVDGEKRTIRQYLIDTETQRRMEEEHGDLLATDSIKDEAIDILHSNGQAEVIAAELRAMGRTGGTSPMPAQVARQWARGVIEGRQIKEATKAWFYAREEAKAGRAVEKALLAGDREAALRHQQSRLLNHVLYMEARDANKYVETATRRMERMAEASRVKGLDPDYLEQIHTLLERFDFRQASGAEVERRHSLRDWVIRQEGQGAEVRIRDSLLNDAFRKHYTELTLDEFRGLDEAVENIAHIGRLKNTLLDRADRRDFMEVVQEAVSQIDKSPKLEIDGVRNPGHGGRGMDRIGAKWSSAKSALRSFDASLLKMEQVFDWLDNGDQNGVFNRVIFRRIADAQHVESDMRKTIATKMRKLTDALPKEAKEDFQTRYQLDELIDSRTGQASQMLKSEIIALALNTGNASNLDKMLRGEGWAESAVRTVLDRHMTKADWQFVQGIWDMLEEFWPQIADMEKRLSGVVPEKTPPLAIKNQHGEFAGGYYPVVYDPLRSYDVELNRQRSADTLFENNYQRATTAHGFTIERIKTYARPLYLSLDVLPRHLGQVAHDLAFREAVIESDRFLQNRDIRQAVESTLGPEIYKQFRPWLQAIANERNYDERGLAWWDQFAHAARTNASLVGMGFRITTMMAQLGGLGDVAEAIGPRWVASGLKSFYGAPAKMVAARDFVFERSGEMRHRMSTLERDIQDGLRELAGEKGPITEVRRFAYYGIGIMDMAVSLPAWLGAYNKALHSGLSEADAIFAGDKAVRTSQGAGAIKDQAAMQRGSEFHKLITMFYSYFNHFYNRQRAIGHDFQSAKDLPMVAARSFWLMVVPPLYAAWVSGNKPKEDEEPAAWAARMVATNMFGGIPVARDVANAAFGGFDYKFTPAARAIESFGKSGRDVLQLVSDDGEVSDKWLKHAIETPGYVFGLPTGQVGTTVQFLWDVMDSKQDPEGLADWLRGLTSGKLDQEK